MIDFINKTNDKKINKIVPKLEKMAKKIIKKDFELIFVNNKKIKKLNKKYRNINKATDVLSFAMNDSFFNIAGTVIISLEYAKKVAKKLNHSTEDEIKLLLIHALLHLSGYDHERDNGQMRKKEKKLIKKFHLPKSLIIRSHTL